MAPRRLMLAMKAFTAIRRPGMIMANDRRHNAIITICDESPSLSEATTMASIHLRLFGGRSGD